MTENQKKYEVAKKDGSYSQRFTALVVREFSSTVGQINLSLHQQRLAQHLFVGCDNQLRELEAKRQKDNKDGLPIVWSNIDMEKLALDAVHRIELGLDALIPNHIHPIPYFNNKTKKYKLDLQVGYIGKDLYKRRLAIDPPKDIIYQLVHESDVFTPTMKSGATDVETYDFRITKPFDRGPVVGGFGYIIREDPTKNQLIIVPKSSFDASQKKAKSGMFWGPYPEEMQMVVLVRRVTAKINVDPEKVNSSYAAVEMDDNGREISQFANQDVIDIDPEPERITEAPEPENPTRADTAGRAFSENKPGRSGIAPAALIHTGPETVDLDAVSLTKKQLAEAKNFLKNSTGTRLPESAPKTGNGSASIVCPKSKSQTRKQIAVCDKCNDRGKCEPYKEYQHDQQPAGGEAGEGPEF